MKTSTRTSFALLLMMTALSFTTTAAEISIKSQNLERQYQYIDTENKVYIQPSNIYFLQNQMYLQIAGELIPIQHLLCDDNGIFILIQEIEIRRRIKPATWICQNPKCRRENNDNIDYCGWCGIQRYDNYNEN